MKLAIPLAICVAIFVLSASASRAEPVPSHASGVWSFGACGDDAPAVLVNSSAAIMIENPEGTPSVAVAKAAWVGGSIVLTLRGEEDVILPPLNSLRSCETLPGVMPILFAETISVFGRLGELDAACMGEHGITARCAALAFDAVDITGDGRFSKAEISRLVRAAGFFIGHRLVADRRQVAFVPLEELYLAQLAAAALGPLVATNLVDSYDFDGDGFVSLAELMQDRSPEKGLEGALASVASGMAPEALSAVLKSATGLLGLFQ